LNLRAALLKQGDRLLNRGFRQGGFCGAGAPQRRYDRCVAAAQRPHQRRFAGLIRRGGIGAELEQRLDQPGVAGFVERRPHQRRRPRAIAGIHVRAPGDHHPHQIDVLSNDREHDRRHADEPAVVRIGAAREQSLRLGDVVVQQRADERCFRGEVRNLRTQRRGQCARAQ